MRLYTADAIKEQVHKLLCRDCGETDYCPNCDYRELIEQILDAPTVDAVPTDFHDRCMQIEIEKRFGMEEVVHCKDCKYFDHSDFGKGEEYWCKHFVSTDDYTHSHKVIEDDFCAWGERRIDETD